ncbi:cereblon family protein [Desulfosarcina sp.]|uniref:cereblon family protein n=1 Tax=Desulfosarcina sp. TaxID=2027861 RepID=UPI0029B8A7A1|nr:cereblon family protein [Desulfosarcina sp.]MDX2455369.1 cereblon family protein [Desulfosarcina sp.]
MNRSLVKAGCRWPHPLTQNRSLYRFRHDPNPEKGGVDSIVAPQDKTSAASAEAIVCRQCLHVITSYAERRVINGAHAHTLANPEGIVFEIACYRNAWGCGYVGPASAEFTWFAGYVWRVAVCVNCHVHLGWHFSAPGGHFFHGLIASRLIVKDT